MVKLLNILDKLEKWNPSIALVAIAITILYYLFYLFVRSIELIHKIKFKKIALIKEHLPSVQAEDLKNAYHDIIEAYYFKEATGIYVEDKRIRSSLIQLKEKNSYPWKDVKRVYPFFVIENGEVKSVKIPRANKISYWVASVIYWIFGLLFIVLFISLAEKPSFLNILLSLFPLLPASLTLPLIWKVRSAKKMEKEINMLCQSHFRKTESK